MNLPGEKVPILGSIVRRSVGGAMVLGVVGVLIPWIGGIDPRWSIPSEVVITRTGSTGVKNNNRTKSYL